MKKSLFFGATLWAISGAATAQSSVNLSVIIDAAMRHTTNSAGGLNSLVSGSNSTSRLITVQ